MKKHRKTSIALIGFMGAGKSAVGKVLAEKLGKKLVEMDTAIVRKSGKSIPQIFSEGEIAFRELEIDVVKKLASGRNQIISCGGGVVLNKINIDRLKIDSLIVWLTANPAIILKRTETDKSTRPLLKSDSKIADIRELLRFRKPYYERAADIKIDTSKLDVKTVADQIIKKLSEYEDFNS
jgi:shikimate kinase